MPVTQNAKKALRSSKRKREYNRKVKSQYKTKLDKLKKEKTQEALNEVYSAIAKAEKRNIFHKNKAARLKSQAAEYVKATSKT